MKNVDSAKAIFDVLRVEWEENKAEIDSEQDARYRIIDRMIREVLFWPDNSIKAEPHVDKGFIDYLMIDQARSVFVVEAKKVSALLIDTKMPGQFPYKISGPALRSASEAISQVENYCVRTGAPFCCVTNGYEWIGHWFLRGDGLPASEYKAITFPNLNAIAQDFAIFFDLFSYFGVQKRLYKVLFQEAEGLKISPHETLRPIRDPRGAKVLQRSELARDLDSVFKAFFSSMSGDNDPEMLAHCFVESKESRNAEASLEKIARNLIDNIEIVADERSDRLQREIQDAVDTSSKEFVLIIGNKGAGKSTFIERFFDLTLDKALRDKCLLLKVDLRDSDGNINQIQDWLTDRLVVEAEKGLFPGKDFLNYDDLQGVFHRNYQQWANGEHKHLYAQDKHAFKVKFGDFVHQIRENDKRRYLTTLLWHATGARKLMPCLVFDNTDHYAQSFQEAVFQYAQSVHRASFTFVICPITDRTIWQLSKAGPLQSYDSKAFYLPVPSTKEILQKRVEFIQNKTTQQKASAEQYFLKKGIRLSIADLQAFAACIEGVFIHTDYVSRTVSWLCNFDIRRSLALTHKVLSSPHISIDELVKTYLAGGRLKIHEHSIRKALFLGDYSHFTSAGSEFIVNLFNVLPNQISSPLTRISVLQLLKDRDANKEDSDHSYMEARDICSYLDGMGISPNATQGHLEKLLEYRCIESYDPTAAEIREDTKLKITSSGLIHIEFCLADHTYMEHVGLTTEVRESVLIDEIRTIFSGRSLGTEQWNRATNTFAKYCVDQDLALCTIPSSYVSQRLMRHEFCRRWGISATSTPTEDEEHR